MFFGKPWSEWISYIRKAIRIGSIASHTCLAFHSSPHRLLCLCCPYFYQLCAQQASPCLRWAGCYNSWVMLSKVRSLNFLKIGVFFLLAFVGGSLKFAVVSFKHNTI